MHVTKVKKTICHGYRPHISTTWHSQNSKIIEMVKRSKVTRCYEYAATAAIKSLQSCPTVWPHRREPTRLPSLEFSRQEHWSGLPFPSPMHESEKWQWSSSFGSDSERPHGLLHPWDESQAPLSMGFSRQEYWSRLPFPSLVMSMRMMNKNYSETILYVTDVFIYVNYIKWKIN